MDTVTTDELMRQPSRIVADAQRGEAALVTQHGEPLLLAIPLGEGFDAAEVRLELAARLYDRGRVSLGLAARLAGLGYADMLDELGRRGVATIRLEPGELERELATFDR